MTLKSLLGGAAIAALAFAASAPVAAADIKSTTQTETSTQTGAATGATTGTVTGTTGATTGAGSVSGSATGSAGASTDTSGVQTTTGAGATTDTAGERGKSGASAGVSLTTVANPEQTLANATVQDKSGAAVGQVKQVVLSKNGKPTEVYIQVEGKVVMVKAAQLKFHKDTNVVMTTMTKAEIEALPQATGI
ncbi:MAG: hypothetical protein ACT4OG_01760 [Alphaproteobacteria bacterium]